MQSKMLTDFCAIRDGLVAELKTEDEPVWITAWEEREGIDGEDFNDCLSISISQFVGGYPALMGATLADPVSVTALARAMFTMGWELSKLEQIKRQVGDLAS